VWWVWLPSRKYKMELLELVSNKYKLVCGSETGHDATVPYVHYFEGMMSLGPYRVSCHDFVNNQVRLQLFVLAYNLGNFLRRLALPPWPPNV
jgi:hypothetical protein